MNHQEEALGRGSPDVTVTESLPGLLGQSSSSLEPGSSRPGEVGGTLAVVPRRCPIVRSPPR